MPPLFKCSKLSELYVVGEGKQEPFYALLFGIGFGLEAPVKKVSVC